MGSLTAHLLETGDHGRLGFHPSCPVCRHERLSGSLSSEPVISRRVQAALASGVLAFSAAAPAAAIAKDPDRQQEGVAAPEQPGSGDLDAPDFDPGGETPLPFEVAPSPNAPVTGGGSDDTGEGAPVDSEPVDDPDARLLATEPETETPTGEGDAAAPPVGEAPVPPAPPGSAVVSGPDCCRRSSSRGTEAGLAVCARRSKRSVASRRKCSRRAPALTETCSVTLRVSSA